MSLFRQPEEAKNITIMVRGGPGVGKTVFALGVKRCIEGKKVAYISNDRGANFYSVDPEIGGFLQVETNDITLVRQAVDELKADAGKNFGAVIVDTVTGVWDSEQSKFEKLGRDGVKRITQAAWRPMRSAHEQLLRDLQALPLHTILICEEKPNYVRKGEDLLEEGTKEDADRKDSYVCDVRLRLFIEGKTYCAEVFKDRTRLYGYGDIVENPKVELWIKGTAQPGEAARPIDPAEAEAVAMLKGQELVTRIRAIKTIYELENWKKKHGEEIKALEPFAQVYDAVLAAGAEKRAALQKPKSETQPEEAA